MTSYETERALVHFAEQIIKTFGKEIGIQDLIQGQKEQGMKYRGLYTFDTDNHKYVPIVSADGIIDLLDTYDYVPAEPVIKDEKIRKFVRDWATFNKIVKACIQRPDGKDDWYKILGNDKEAKCAWAIYIHASYSETVSKGYNCDAPMIPITELCGEEEA